MEKKLKESQICFDFLFVPGNHDCNFEGDLSVRNLILDGLNNDETKLNDSVLNHLAATQFNFSNFNSSVCTMEPIFDNNIVKSAMFVGGGKLTHYLCRLLEDTKIKIKI